ncbi:LpqB family beta-propeller domain-containing protein [Gemmata sp. JC673]|uniref:LpqB family beta-propeller domain-containing protein n=1 Tax=Gemmata algarum TaxID=2975278 RepID=A0ABU5EYL4_9BACT|nr:LpqB family beta-propeller domain-containing protein [Gemmata algarum]MDY3558898.1 LpqB family beta-propeller domain-containing protein [Gemmata algarum]
MRRVLALCLFVAAAGHLSAAPERTHDITPADYAGVNTITEIALSPDGKQVAYTLATWDKKGDKRATELWVVDTDGKGKPKQLTTDRANDRHPKWSADGKAVFVLANRKGKAQVWKVPLDGAPEAVTSAKGGVIGYDYAPKADAVFYTVDDTVTDKGDFLELREKFAKIEYGHNKRTVSKLLRIDPKEEPREVLANGRYIREFAVTADGKRIALVSALDDTVIRSEGESRVDVWEDGKVTTPPTDVYRAKAASPYAWLEGLAWNPAGTRFAFCAIHDAYPAEVIIGEWGGGTWTTGRMNRTKLVGPERSEGWVHVHGYGSPLQWTGNDALSYLHERAGQVNLRTYVLKDGATHVPPPDYQEATVEYAVHFAATPPLRAVIAGSQNGLPVLKVQVKATGEPETLVDPNPHTADWKFPSVKHVTWKAPDGTEIGGPLELPYGWKKGDKPLPLVVAIHGGPTTSSPNDLRFDPHNGRLYFAAAGYAVLCPNYRGSTGYGDKFVTDLIGNENDVDVKDILAGIEHLIKEGVADPERVAVMGWSNGGYLTNCLITLKDPPVKIKAASSGAGILDTVAEWGFNDEPAYPVVFKKGTPWEQPEIYKKTSPTYGLGNVTTPTLIHVGGNDDRCPPGHSRMLYRALKEYKNVPTQLCVYPNQPHGLGALSFRTAKMEWDLAWFDKYLNKK